MYLHNTVSILDTLCNCSNLMDTHTCIRNSELHGELYMDKRATVRELHPAKTKKKKRKKKVLVSRITARPREKWPADSSLETCPDAGFRTTRTLNSRRLIMHRPRTPAARNHVGRPWCGVVWCGGGSLRVSSVLTQLTSDGGAAGVPSSTQLSLVSAGTPG